MLKWLPLSAPDQANSDTALGDWYVNRVVVDRQPLLLFVASGSLLAMVCPARNVGNLANWFANLVAGRLRRLGMNDGWIESEVLAMSRVEIGRTQDRSVTGTMVDFAKALPFYLPTDGWDAGDLTMTEDKFAETPCHSSHAGDTIWPRKRTAQLLAERWQSPKSVH